MKFIVITAVLGAGLIAPAMAQQAQQAPQTQSRQGWGSKVHVYAAEYYVQHHGNSNANPDFQLGGRER
jgi:opacity protein-like surface antigen